MSNPKITDIVGGYDFLWDAEAVQIRVSRIHANGDGKITGEILVTTSAPGYSPHLHQAAFNFLSSTTRKQLAKQLKEEYETDWDNILEQLCVYTSERVRRGEPVEDIIATGENIEPPKYILEPYIIENYPNVFFGDPGSFKSTMAVVVMACVVLPWYDNPLHLKTPSKPVRTLFLDWETDSATVAWQLSCFQRGMGTPAIPIKYRRCSLPLHADVEQIQKAIADSESKLIVIDSLGLACGGELNEAGAAIQFFTALRQLKVTSLILAHTSKDKTSSNKSIYGSVFFEAQARSVWHLRKRQEAGEDELDLALKNTKSPPFRKKFADMGYHVSFTDDSMVVKTEDPREVAEFLETMGTQSRVLELLKEGAKNPAAIAKALDLTENNVRVVISNLKKSNKVLKVGDGYGLPYKDY